ncbi:hypothetical protein EDD21DRAFT_386621 [Dissophora ornata]|nr:hypothetical protein EDD21DRAFT_386621 [Dissophora ornata]
MCLRPLGWPCCRRERENHIGLLWKFPCSSFRTPPPPLRPSAQPSFAQCGSSFSSLFSFLSFFAPPLFSFCSFFFSNCPKYRDQSPPPTTYKENRKKRPFLPHTSTKTTLDEKAQLPPCEKHRSHREAKKNMSSNPQSANYALRVGAIALLGGVIAYWLWTSSSSSSETKPKKTSKTKKTITTTTTTTKEATANGPIDNTGNETKVEETTTTTTTTTTATPKSTTTTTAVKDEPAATDLIEERTITDTLEKESTENIIAEQLPELGLGATVVDDVVIVEAVEETVVNDAIEEEPVVEILERDIVTETPANVSAEVMAEAVTKVIEVAVLEETSNEVIIEDAIVEDTVTVPEATAFEEPVVEVIAVETEKEEEEKVQEQATQEEKEEEWKEEEWKEVDVVLVDEQRHKDEHDHEEVFEMVFEREVMTHEQEHEETTSEEQSEAETEAETPTTLVGDEMNLSRDTLIEEVEADTVEAQENLSKVTDSLNLSRKAADPWETSNHNDDKVQTLREVSRVAQHSELNAAAPEFKPSWVSSPSPAPAPRAPATRDAPSSQDQQGKMKSRCRFWPKCTNKSCKFTHPSLPCRDPENCSFGDRCIFMHPNDLLPRPSRHSSLAKKRRPISSDSSATMVAATPEEIWT